MAPENSSDSDNTSVEAIARNTDDNTLVGLEDDGTKTFQVNTTMKRMRRPPVSMISRCSLGRNIFLSSQIDRRAEGTLTYNQNFNMADMTITFTDTAPRQSQAADTNPPLFEINMRVEQKHRHSL